MMNQNRKKKKLYRFFRMYVQYRETHYMKQQKENQFRMSGDDGVATTTEKNKHRK